MFKKIINKTFSYAPRYYDERKERIQNLENGKKIKISFRNKKTKSRENGRFTRIFIIILILTFISYIIIKKTKLTWI